MKASWHCCRNKTTNAEDLSCPRTNHLLFQLAGGGWYLSYSILESAAHIFRSLMSLTMFVDGQHSHPTKEDPSVPKAVTAGEEETFN